jgi:hypothetical protein
LTAGLSLVFGSVPAVCSFTLLAADATVASLGLNGDGLVRAARKAGLIALGDLRRYEFIKDLGGVCE